MVRMSDHRNTTLNAVALNFYPLLKVGSSEGQCEDA